MPVTPPRSTRTAPDVESPTATSAGSGSAESKATGSTSRRTGRGRPGYDRETLVAKSIEVFMHRGYRGTSMDALAKELGITKSAIYHHVGSKEDLLSAAIAQGLDALEAVVAEAEARSDDTCEERLRGVIRGSVEVLVAHQASVTLLLRIRDNSEVERKALAKRRRIDARITALVAAAIAEGTVRADLDAALVTRLLFGMVNSLTEWYRPRSGQDAGAGAEAIADAITAIAFEGLERR